MVGKKSFFTFFLIALVSGQWGCTSSFAPVQEMTSELNSTDHCKAPAGVSNSPKTIEEALSLVNALPKPVTVPCFLASLARPLKMSLTNNILSAQPANGDRSPRVFIINDNLLISVVPEGVGQDLVEFSLVTAPDRSIKAEIEFPVLNILPADAPYNQVKLGEGTICRSCHGGETRATQVTFAEAYESKAFQPPMGSKVDIEAFRAEVALCDPKVEKKRCEIIDALFNNGEVQSEDFPADMPVFF